MSASKTEPTPDELQRRVVVIQISKRLVATTLVTIVALSAAVGFSVARFATPDPAGAASATAASVAQVRDPALISAVKALGKKLASVNGSLGYIQTELVDPNDFSGRTSVGGKLDSLLRSVGVYGSSTLNSVLHEICRNTLPAGASPTGCLP